MTATNKINWLSVLQGWSMLLVVIGHVTLTNVFQNPETPISAEIERIIYSFHMPLFMFISGFLFYLTKIGQNKNYGETVWDKTKRLLIPYAAFTCATFFLKYAFNPLMKRPVDFSWSEVLDILTFTSNPLAEMWFISTLFALFLFFPLYKWSLGNKVRSGLLFCAAVLVYFFFPKDIELFCISYASKYLLFFYTGILVSKYGGGKFFDNPMVLSCSAVLMVLCSLLPGMPLLNVFVGIFFSLTLCMFLSRHFPGLFGSFREYTFQIFLMGIFFQMAIRFVYARLGMECFYWPLYIVSILLALYMPVLISMIIRKTGSKTLARCFGL